MLYRGGKLSAVIPEDITIWSWLFESGQLSVRATSRLKGGFRDASNAQFLSFDDVKALATQLSTTLAQKYGIRQGSGICIFASNSIWYPVALFAAVRLGAVVTCSSPDYGADEMQYILQSAEAKLIFADQVSAKAARSAANSLGLHDENIVLINSPSESTHETSLQNLLAEAGRLSSSADEIPTFKLARGQSNKDVCAYLSFTSGTTSRPKGVMISHHNVIAQIMQMRSLTRKDAPKVLLGVLPLFHITGLVQILQLPIVLEQEVVIMPKFDMRAMLETIVKYKCDELWLVPPLLIRLVNDPVAAGYDLPLVKQFNTGAAPLAQEIVDKLEKRFSHIAIRQAWGMTESTSALTLTPPDAQTYENAHTVGTVVPETILKIIDTETGKEVEEGGSGEIWAKGPQVTMGYKNNREATAEAFDAEGYLHTGDIGSMLPGGLLLIQDRLKEMIKVKGVGIAPAELEDLLLGHPLVVDVAVIGISDSYSGELPKAFVVLDSNAKPNQETSNILQEFVRKKKSRSKWLGGGVEFVDQIPKSASGKILRRVLRDSEKAKVQRNTMKSRL